MQAVAADFSGYAGKPPSLFELRRSPLPFQRRVSNSLFDSFYSQSLLFNRGVASV